MSVETKTHEIAYRRENLKPWRLNERDFTIHEIEQVLKGAILGKGKAEQTVRKSILGFEDLKTARKTMLSSLQTPEITNLNNLNLDTESIDNLSSIIGIQMKAVALSKKEKGVDDKDPQRLTLRAEVIKDDGFCKKVYKYTQDPANKDRVTQALHILAADLDQDRLDAKVKLHNDTFTKGRLSAMFSDSELVDIKDERDQAEIGEEIPRLNDEQRERVREHVATRRLLEKEQLEKIQKEIDSKSEAEEEESNDLMPSEPEEERPTKEVSLNWNKISRLSFATLGTAGVSAALLSEGLLFSGLIPETSSGLSLGIAITGGTVGIVSLAGLIALRQLERKQAWESLAQVGLSERNFLFDKGSKTWHITRNGIDLRFSKEMFKFLQDEHSVQERNRILDEYAEAAQDMGWITRWWYLRNLARQKPLEVISSS